MAALGLMGLKFVTLPDAAAVAPGDALKIEVVAPVEPEPVPGSVMEVGELVDGFRYVPTRPAEPPLHDVAWSEDEDFAPWAPPVQYAEVRRYNSAEAPAPSEPEPPRRERDRRWFGFDNPLPDFGAERRARQARLDALEDQRRAERDARGDSRRYYSAPAPDRPADESDEGPYGPEVG
ncbi:hypothetical protein [Brevundimonas sp.]|uniref:hypothetical protein n=1 Tax=Brevundimonas sp. TaxID=1871086 RepID=UPI002FC8BB6C